MIDAEDDAEYDQFINFFNLPYSLAHGVIPITEEDFPVTRIPTPPLSRDKQLAFAYTDIPGPPSSRELAELACQEYADKQGIAMEVLFREATHPGDMIQDLMDIGWALLVERQRGIYPKRVVNAMRLERSKLGEPLDPDSLLTTIMQELEGIRKVFLGMDNSIKSLAGYVFQEFVRIWFDSNGIPNTPQPQLKTGHRNPDFVLPNIELYESPTRKASEVMLMALKTTLKERWSQVVSEGKNLDKRYLLTLDQKVSKGQIDEMAAASVVLVVRETLKTQNEVYKAAANVITYFQLLSSEIAPKLVSWVT